MGKSVLYVGLDVHKMSIDVVSKNSSHLRPHGCGLPGYKFFLAFCVSLI